MSRNKNTQQKTDDTTTTSVAKDESKVVEQETQTTAEQTAQDTAEQTGSVETTTEVAGDASAEEQAPEAPAETQDPAQEVVDETATEFGIASEASGLKPHQALELRAFCEHLDEYVKRYEYKDVEHSVDVAAHRKLHAAVRMLVNFDEVVLREAYADLLNRFRAKHANSPFGMPTVLRHLSNPEVVSNAGERVFISEFLTLSSQFARSGGKGIDRKSVAKVMETVTDLDTRSRLEELFVSV